MKKWTRGILCISSGLHSMQIKGIFFIDKQSWKDVMEDWGTLGFFLCHRSTCVMWGKCLKFHESLEFCVLRAPPNSCSWCSEMAPCVCYAILVTHSLLRFPKVIVKILLFIRTIRVIKSKLMTTQKFLFIQSSSLHIHQK